MAAISTLVDDFDDGSKDAAKWESTFVTTGLDAAESLTVGGTTAETGGSLELRPTDSAAQVMGYLSLDRTYELSSSNAYIKLKSITRGQFRFQIANFTDSGGGGLRGSGWYMCWEMTRNGSNQYDVRAIWNYFGGTGTTFSATITSALADYAWLRLRDDGSDLYWESAPDVSGSPGTWTVRRQGSTSGVTRQAINDGALSMSMYNSGSITGCVATIESLSTPVVSASSVPVYRYNLFRQGIQ